MGIEVLLRRISGEDLQQLQTLGLHVGLPAIYEQASTDSTTRLLVDEHILAFMSHQQPEHPILLQAVVGGTEFTDSAEREEYPRFYSPNEVTEIAQVLHNIPRNELQARFETLKHIVGGVSVDGTDKQAWQRIQARFQAIADFYELAAQHNQAILLVLY